MPVLAKLPKLADLLAVNHAEQMSAHAAAAEFRDPLGAVSIVGFILSLVFRIARNPAPTAAGQRGNFLQKPGGRCVCRSILLRENGGRQRDQHTTWYDCFSHGPMIVGPDQLEK